MILLILKSYLTILLSVGIGSILILFTGLYLIFRKPSKVKSVNHSVTPAKIETSENIRDLSAIAGDDVLTTQLDLARAFIETGRVQSAKSILKTVIEQGNHLQQEEAQKLMKYI